MKLLYTAVRYASAIAIILGSGSVACIAQNKATDAASAAQMQQLKNYPLDDFGELFIRLKKDLEFPAPRHESHLLPLLPQSTVFYAAFPNYGNTAQQALKIFQQERQSRPALRKWWQSEAMAKTGPQLEMAIEAAANLSQYVGDEIVIAGSMNGTNPPSVVLLSEVRKPGLKEALDFALQLAAKGAAKPPVRVLDKAGLASATETMPRGMTVLVRPDYVIAASDLKTLRDFDQQLDSGIHNFASTSFGQRLQQSYDGGVAVLAGADLQTILRHAPIPPQQSQVLQRTGFADVKYAIWEHKGVAGQAASEGELSFTRPRRGIASWLAAPRELGGLDFASPKAILVASIALKNLGEVFDDVQTLASATNPRAFAPVDQMQQGLGLSLKDDLLSQLSGEITLEVDGIEQEQPAWRAMLQVKDATRLQQTFNKLLAMAPVSPQEFKDGGTTYHSLTVPSPNKAMEVDYAFVDGYLVVGSSKDSLRQAVQLHRTGGSLAKSSAFLAELPPRHSTKMSALYYQDPMKMMGVQMARFSPELAQSLKFGSSESKPVVSCAYADETTIRGASMSQGMDAGAILVAAAVAIPNLLRAKNTANESAAVGTLRNMLTAQVSYSATYPARGYARDLARLGPFPGQAEVVSAQHAGLLDGSFAKPTCTADTWCERSGYMFTFAPSCPKLLCQQFVAIATPMSMSTGSRSFCATSDGVIRFSSGPPLTSAISAAKCNSWEPVQ